MGIAEILGLLVMAAAGWFAWDSLKAREAANATMRAACRAEGLLFLDDTVALESIRPISDEGGQLRVRRIFRFEYSDTGHNRRKGSVEMVGATMSAVDLGPRPRPEDATLQ
jgi:hypothetical protein